MKIRGLIVLLGCSALFSCENTEPKEFDLKRAEEIVLAGQGRYEAAVPIKDINAIMAQYEDDAIYMPVQNTIQKGKANIRTAWEKTLAMNILDFQLETVEVSGTDEMISEVGRTTATIEFNGDTVVFRFKYLNIWKEQENGEYKVHRGIYNPIVEN